MLREGKIEGGGRKLLLHIGSYEEPNPEKPYPSVFRARIEVKPFLPGASSVFKTYNRDITLNLEGTLKDREQRGSSWHSRGY